MSGRPTAVTRESNAASLQGVSFLEREKRREWDMPSQAESLKPLMGRPAEDTERESGGMRVWQAETDIAG